jgi:hypothetical protein
MRVERFYEAYVERRRRKKPEGKAGSKVGLLGLKKSALAGEGG